MNYIKNSDSGMRAGGPQMLAVQFKIVTTVTARPFPSYYVHQSGLMMIDQESPYRSTIDTIAVIMIQVLNEIHLPAMIQVVMHDKILWRLSLIFGLEAMVTGKIMASAVTAGPCPNFGRDPGPRITFGNHRFDFPQSLISGHHRRDFVTFAWQDLGRSLKIRRTKFREQASHTKKQVET